MEIQANEVLWAQGRLAALLLLILYAAAIAVLLPRELAFLRGVEQPQRGWFITQDVLLQVCVLLVLGTSVLIEQLDAFWMSVVAAGFTGLWIVVIWTGIARYGYTLRIVHKAREEGEARLRELRQQMNDEERKRD